MTPNSNSRRRRSLAAGAVLALLTTMLPFSTAFAEDAGTPTPAETSGTATPAAGTSGADSAEPESSGDASEPASSDETVATSANPEAASSDDPNAKEQPISAKADAVSPSLAINVTIGSDGTPNWDADDNAGNDSGPSNGVVRVNDTITYRVQYSVNDATGVNTTFTIKFPKGVEITNLPGFCQASGSSITPATAGTPALPLTATSIDELDEQVLTCNVGNKDNAADTVNVTVKVLNLLHQGAAITPLEASISAEGAAPVADTTLPTVTASSRLKWDISKNHTALTENTGYFYGPDELACPWDATLVCKRAGYSALFFAPAGGKGAMPAIGDVAFTDDLTPEAMYPTLTAAQHTAINADLAKYGSRIVSCVDGTDWAVPGRKIDGTQGVYGRTATNSVRDSGACSVTQSGPGAPAKFTISNADWSLRTYPTQAIRPVNTTLPAGQAYAAVVLFQVWTPVAVIRDFGIESQSTWTLATTNAFTELDIDGFTAADHQTSADQPAWNDYRRSTPIIRLTGPMNKFFMGLPGEPGNTSGTEWTPGFPTLGQGPAGAPGGINTGGVTVAETQRVSSQLHFVGSSPGAPSVVTYLACDAWDPTKLNLDRGDYALPAGSIEAFQAIPSGGEAVWLSGYNNVLSPSGAAVYATSAAQAPTLQVEYSAVAGGSGAASECGDAQGPWYDSPEDVPGNDPALVADGVYTAVARVRVHLVLPEPVAISPVVATGVRAAVTIALRVADADFPTGTVLPNWAGVKSAVGSVSAADMLSADRPWTRSAYQPGTDRSNGHTGSLGDRLILAHAQARIDKQVRRGDSGSFSDTPPQVTGGDLVQYRLAPSLTSGACVPGIFKDVWVEDCLPASQTYSAATVTPSVVSLGSTPADAKRPACAAGETYIRWVLLDQEVNQAIEPIIMDVEVAPTADDGVYNNTVVVWAKDDESTLAQRRDDAQIQIANIAGVKLEKIALTPVVQNNRPGQATNELNKWLVKLTNTLPDSDTSGIADPDVIDVLPKQGTIGTNFAGTFTFSDAQVVDGGPTVKLLYTSAVTVDRDPADASNGASGATTWCDAPAGGAVVSGTGACPSSAAQVTGLRIQRPGAYRSGEVISLQLSMVGVGNQAGDVYVNRAFARATGLQFAVGPVDRAETVISSSVGDYTWWDLSRDGEQGQVNGEDEPVAPNVPVTLSGTDDLGNTVNLSTTSDADGKYSFAGLRSSGADGYTVTFTKLAQAEGFTTRSASGVDAAKDSNPDATTGVSPALVLGPNTHDRSIDAGLVASGGLKIFKALEGVGVAPFGADDELTFNVACTFGGVEVLNREVTLAVNGGTSVASEVIGNLPALTECVVTETSQGDADSIPAPVTVTVPWNPSTQTTGVVTASLTNYYSAGEISVTKKVVGDKERTDQVKDTEFSILVTCQLTEGDVVSDVYSGVVKIKGGQTVKVARADGVAVKLPLGTSCFGTETVNGGADTAVIDHDSPATAVVVSSGTPAELQQLSLSATNTFRCTDATCPSQGGLVITKLLKGTGVQPFGSDDELTFSVLCTFGGKTVLDTKVTLAVKGGESVTSKVIGPVNGNSTCVITETGTGDADLAPAPVTVTVPWDGGSRQAGVVTASLTNYYSAGRIRVAKVLQGDAQRVKAVADKVFKVQVTCQVDSAGTVATVYSDVVGVKGGELVDATDASGSPVLLPLGAHCFGTEIDDGGATTAVVDYDSSANAVSVSTGQPDAVQQLTLTATNTLLCDSETCPVDDVLAFTGGAAISAGVAGLALLMLGLGFVLFRRSRQQA